MTDRDRINRDIDEGFKSHLLALADWHAEHGEPWVAKGYRWLADHGKSPSQTNFGDRFKWYARPSSSQDGYDNFWNLPDGCRGWLAMSRNGTEAWYPSRSEAYEAAAVAIGEWLKGGEGLT